MGEWRRRLEGRRGDFNRPHLTTGLQSPVSISKSGFTQRSGHWEINLLGCTQSVSVLTAGGAGDDIIISGGSEGHTPEMRKSRTSCTQLYMCVGVKGRECKKGPKSEAHVLLMVQKDHEWLDGGVFQAMGNCERQSFDGCL